MVAQNWIAVKIATTEDAEETISSFLIENGSVGCSIENDVLIAYFDESQWTATLNQRITDFLIKLREAGFRIPKGNVVGKKFINRDWNAEWKRSLKPIYVGPDLIIKPSWTELKDTDENALVVELDPQMAFGAGSHATTQLMLRLIRSQLDDPKRILDIGTGSGILAITAAKLFRCQVVANDIDPSAVETARENARKNHVAERIHLFTGTIDSLIVTQFDAILANINRTEIEKIFPFVPQLLKVDGILLLSGILIEEEKIINELLNKINFKALLFVKQDEWLGIASKYQND